MTILERTDGQLGLAPGDSLAHEDVGMARGDHAEVHAPSTGLGSVPNRDLPTGDIQYKLGVSHGSPPRTLMS